MPITAKMHCNSVTSAGGGVWVPVCVAKTLLDSWPPEEHHLGKHSIIGHGEGECAACDQIASEQHGSRIAHVPGKGRESIQLSAVMAGGPDDPNSKWAAATPVGELSMDIDNPHAWGFFDAGSEYIVEIRKHVPSRGRRESTNG